MSHSCPSSGIVPFHIQYPAIAKALSQAPVTPPKHIYQPLSVQYLSLPPFCSVCFLAHKLPLHPSIKPDNAPRTKNHICTICKAGFSQKGSLNRHVTSVHHNERPFKCTYGECTKAFSRKDSLKLHINAIHLDHRPHKCPDCGKRFVDRKGLRLHYNAVHLGIRPYRCDKCGNCFAQPGNLKVHAKAHLRKDILRGAGASDD